MGRYITFDGCSGTGKDSLIACVARQLESSTRKVIVLADRDLDPLRDHAARMLPWVEKYGLHKQSFLFSLYVAGGMIAEEKVKEALRTYDIVLRNRSFITSLATQTCDDVFTQDDVMDLYMVYMNYMAPDLAVIVDSDVPIAMEREAKRSSQDKGLGGRMSGSADRRERMRRKYLEIPQRFHSWLDAIVVVNNGAFTEDAEEVGRRVTHVSLEVLGALSERKLI